MIYTGHKLLIVEDDKNQGFLLSSHLKSVGLQNDLAIDGEEGLELYKSEDYALCILDIMMPKLDGVSLVKKMNALDKDTPFIFLSARNLKSDKMTGYEMGCEDYITKPFDIDVLVHKINVILKRSSGIRRAQKNLLKAGQFELNVQERILNLNGEKSFSLTQKETSLLKLLFENFNESIPRKTLMINTWGNDDFFTSKSLDVHLSRIRKYLNNDSGLKLVNIHGYGYKLSGLMTE